VHRLIASLCYFAAREVSQACSCDCAAASFVDDEKVGLQGMVRTQVKGGARINAREGDGQGGSPPTEKRKTGIAGG